MCCGCGSSSERWTGPRWCPRIPVSTIAPYGYRVLAFQQSRALKPDGVVGRETLVHLDSALRRPVDPVSSDLGPTAPERDPERDRTMSFILEALKRVEREREAAGQPRLGAVQRLRTPRRFVWPWVFCIALAANAGVVWTLWHPVPPTAEGVGPPMTPPAPAAVAGDQAGPKTAEAGHRTATPEPFESTLWRSTSWPPQVGPREAQRRDGPLAPGRAIPAAR